MLSVTSAEVLCPMNYYIRFPTELLLSLRHYADNALMEPFEGVFCRVEVKKPLEPAHQSAGSLQVGAGDARLGQPGHR